jgi:AbrB family looped-hinge helix DNA binding protein
LLFEKLDTHAVLGVRGQLTIPVKMRDRLNMKDGEPVRIIMTEDGDIIIKQIIPRHMMEGEKK